MTCKTIEIRDRATCIPALLVRLDPADERDRALLARAGYGPSPACQSSFVLLIDLTDAPSDPFQHGGGRTLRLAHLHVQDAFEVLENGQVVDVEYLEGETAAPKRSEVTA